MRTAAETTLGHRVVACINDSGVCQANHAAFMLRRV